ncbi:DctP family TRAP transporter solute-binding subunit [Paenibacillus puerhi]|uniref:DctP family TRAP transporter solute-binding subunit n=1 Tax=Paenibacillus puerhi TaxID=2692622 RepID=UPI00135C3D47|nr:DctP family TRAP transporter solute-binding subunit [Paenibacillus puerhi]
MIERVMVRKILLFSLSLIMMTGCMQTHESAVNPSNPSSEPKIVIRFAEINTDLDPITLADKEFARILREKSNGKIEMKVYPNRELGDHQEVIKLLQTGAIDVTRTQASYLADAGVGQLNVFSLPYLFRNADHAWKVLEGEIGDAFLNNIQTSGNKMVGIGYYVTSPRNFFFRDKKVTRLSDIQGLKLRVPTGQIYSDMVKAFGAVPMATDFSDFYAALKTGEVDGGENPMKGYHSGKYYYVAKYYTINQHIADPSIILFSEMTWKNFDLDQRRLIQESFAASAEYFKQISKDQDAKLKRELEAEGVQFFEVEDPDEWRDSVKSLYLKYGNGFEHLIEKIQKIK